MEVTDSKNEKSQQILNAIYKDAEVVFLLNKKEHTYEMLKKNAFWQELMNETGT